jgi:hypothetical protein
MLGYALAAIGTLYQIATHVHLCLKEERNRKYRLYTSAKPNARLSTSLGPFPIGAKMPGPTPAGPGY